MESIHKKRLRSFALILEKLLSKFKRTKSHSDLVSFKKARDNVWSLIKKIKNTYVAGKLNENIGRPKELWKSLKSVGLPSKQDKPSKICLKKDGEHCFDDKFPFAAMPIGLAKY